MIYKGETQVSPFFILSVEAFTRFVIPAKTGIHFVFGFFAVIPDPIRNPGVPNNPGSLLLQG